VGVSTSLDSMEENSYPYWETKPSRSGHSPSLYLLSYPGLSLHYVVLQTERFDVCPREQLSTETFEISVYLQM
jgi:hypothetical protein